MITTSAAVLCLLLPHLAAARTPPDFSGKWKLVPNESASVGGRRGAGTGPGRGMGGGLGLGPSPTDLTITQTATKLTITQHGTAVSKLVFALDGTESRGELPAGGHTRKAVFKSAWHDEKLVTTMTTDAPNGGGKITFQEVRYLTADGQLVVETNDPAHGNSRRVVYARK